MIIGIDPGASGALALVEKPAHIVGVWDMPIKKEKARKRVDAFELRSLFDYIVSLYEPKGCVIEKVGGRPAQSASASFVFGVGYGMLIMLCAEHELRLDYVEPGIWKRAMRCPADKAEAVGRADEIFPSYRELFRNGKHRGKDVLRPDRAEAAMLALWGLEKR